MPLAASAFTKSGIRVFWIQSASAAFLPPLMSLAVITRLGFLGWLAELTSSPLGADLELEQPAARVTAAAVMARRALRFVERAERAPIGASAVCRSAVSGRRRMSVFGDGYLQAVARRAVDMAAELHPPSAVVEGCALHGQQGRAAPF